MAGSLFALLWASASTATKIGLQDAQPLVIAQFRFAIAAIVMLIFSHLIFKYKLPSGKKEWKQISIYGLLNITIYLGCYVVAMETVTAGIGALAVATNPIFISVLTVIFYKRKLGKNIILSLFLGTIGVVVASWPLFEDASVTRNGLLLMLFSMLAYSAGAIYFAERKWEGLHLLTINGWQTAIGGLLLLPLTAYFYNGTENTFTPGFWMSTVWLAIAVSVFAIQLWLWLLQKDAVRAGLWLFFAPVFGFAIAAIVLNDPISIYTFVGVGLVLLALLLVKRPTKLK